MLKRIAGLVALFFYSTLAFAQLDISALDLFLNETLSEVRSYFDFMEVAEISIGPGSDIEKGKVQATLSALTKGLSANLYEKIQIKASLQTEITDGMLEESKKFYMGLKAELLVQTLPVLKHIGINAFDCASAKNLEEDPVTNILCIFFNEAQAATQVTDLQVALKKAADYAKSIYADPSDSQDPVAQVFSTLKISPVGEALLITASLSLNNEELDSAFEMVVSEDGLSLALNGDIVFSSSEVDSYVAKVKEVAEDLTVKGSSSHEKYEGYLYLIFGVLESFILTEDDY